MSYVGKTSIGRVAAGDPIDYAPSVTLANARLTWKNEAGDIAVSAEVQNLFNKYYNPARFAAVYGFSGVIYSQVGKPREWAITVKKTF